MGIEKTSRNVHQNQATCNIKYLPMIQLQYIKLKVTLKVILKVKSYIDT